MQNAAERLLGLRLNEVQQLAEDIIIGQLRLIIATMQIEEINTDRDKFLEAISSNVESELRKIGLRLINVNVTDINDKSGYIEALGKEAAAVGDVKFYSEVVKNYLTNMQTMEFASIKEHYPQLKDAELFYQIFTG